MITAGRSGRRVLAVALAASAVATTAALTSDDSDEVELTAVFADASPLYTGNSVKAAGVTVGEIESITLVDGAARVKMKVDRSILPLHKDAKAVITEQDLLGERYVALDRGSASAPLLDSDAPVIQQSNTSRTVDLQSILDRVDNPTGTALAALVTTLGEGSAGRGKDFADGLRALAPAMQQSGELSKVLSDQNALLAHLVDTVEPVVSAVAADNGAKLDDLIGSSDRTLAQVAADRDALREALTRLPGTLAGARRTLARVAKVADNATPTLASMRPVTHDLRDISGELSDFASAADPALASLRPVLDHAQKLIDKAAPVADALRPAGADLRTTAAGGRTLVGTAASGAALGDLLEFVKNWALITSGYDGLSNYFRVAALATPQALGTTAAGAVPGLPDAPVPGVKPPNLPQTPLSTVLPGLGELLPGLLGNGSATGLSADQENNLMNQLLGGL
jgi:phospholipid/cholesterol/gamma-HCH transport system substrate-binding protein